MADSKISALAEKTSITGNDLFVIVDSADGVNKKVKESTIYGIYLRTDGSNAGSTLQKTSFGEQGISADNITQSGGGLTNLTITNTNSDAEILIDSGGKVTITSVADSTAFLGNGIDFTALTGAVIYPKGNISIPAIIVGTSGNNSGFYEDSDNLVGVAVDGTLVAKFGFNDVKVNTINELTTDAGVVINGLRSNSVRLIGSGTFFIKGTDPAELLLDINALTDQRIVEFADFDGTALVGTLVSGVVSLDATRSIRTMLSDGTVVNLLIAP